MTNRSRLVVVILLAAAGAALSWLLLLEHHGDAQATAAVAAVCGEGDHSGCEQVNRSAYAQVGGVPLAAAGLTFYTSLALLLALALLAGDDVQAAAALMGLVGLGLALAVDLWLLGVQALAIRSFCKLCLATYALNAVGLALLLPLRRAAATFGAALGGGAGRQTVAGWAAASVAVVAAVASTETLLALREAQRAAAVLGAPVREAAPTTTQAAPTAAAGPAATAAPATRPAEPATAADATRFRDEARAAKEEVRQLQETLDDPQKLQKYLEDKAAHDFESAPPQTFDLAKTPFEGPVAAPIRIVTFSDFLCPWCRNLAQGLSGFLPQTAGRVVVYFKNYPLDQTCNTNLKGTVHAGACWVALGGVCAQEQGKFWPYHDKVFGSTLTNPGRDDVVKLAGELGLNTSAFEACIASPLAKERVAADIQEARKVGVTGTPTVFINGKKLPGLNSFMVAIDKESKRLGLPPLQPPQQGK